jgi:soluble lytic murein transglycosylase-like protein
MSIRDGLLLADAVFNQREREQQEFDLKKQDLDLRRKILQGEQASREWRDFQTQLTVQEQIKKIWQESQAAQALSAPPARPAAASTLAPAPAAALDPPGAPAADPGLRPDAGATRGPQPTALGVSQPGNVAALYNRLIREIGTAEGLAPEVIRHAQALIQPESNFDPNAVSPKGAQGLMQLMPATAQRYGVQDPLNPQQNIRGGLRYLADLYQRFPGRPDLVSAAYNAGEGAVEKYGNTVPPYAETQAYVKKVGANLQAAGQEQQSALVRQPSSVQRNPQLDALNAELADVDRRAVALEARLEGIRALSGTDTYKGAQKDLDRLLARKKELETQRRELVKEETPGDIFKAMLVKNRGDVNATIAEYQAFELDKARKNQEAGLSVAADKVAQSKQAELQATKDFQANQTILEAAKKPGQHRLWKDTTTGKSLAGNIKQRDAYEAEANGAAVLLTEEQFDQFNKIEGIVPLLKKVKESYEKVYGPGGIFEKLKPDDRLAAAAKGGWARFTQSNPALSVLLRTLEGNVDLIRRAIMGQVGTQTDRDAQRGMAVFAKVDGIPDSQEVAYELYNILLDVTNSMQGTILGNAAYQNEALLPLAIDTPSQPATKAASPPSSPGAPRVLGIKKVSP